MKCKPTRWYTICAELEVNFSSNALFIRTLDFSTCNNRRFLSPRLNFEKGTCPKMYDRTTKMIPNLPWKCDKLESAYEILEVNARRFEAKVVALGMEKTIETTIIQIVEDRLKSNSFIQFWRGC